MTMMRSSALRSCAWAQISLGLLLLAVVASGCGGESDARPMGAVTGKVTSNGQPVTEGSLTFSPIKVGKDPAGKSGVGLIGSDGTYKVTTSAPNDGAVIGKHRIVYSAPALPFDEKKHSEGVKQPVSPFANLIPSKADVEVKAGPNTIDIELIPDPKAPPAGS